MKNFKRVLLTLVSAMLLVTLTIAGTVAYLTSLTGEVVNTFTAGNVTITLDEAPVDEDGKETTGNRGTANNYNLLPGHDYDKDPTVHVKAGSEPCYLFVKVENGIAAIEAEGDSTIAKQMKTQGWTQLIVNEVAVENVFYYNTTIDASEAEEDIDVVVFETFTISGNVENDKLAEYENAEITIQAYAVQADGFASAAAAWAAAPLNAWTE